MYLELQNLITTRLSNLDGIDVIIVFPGSRVVPFSGQHGTHHRESYQTHD